MRFSVSRRRVCPGEEKRTLRKGALWPLPLTKRRTLDGWRVVTGSTDHGYMGSAYRVVTDQVGQGGASRVVAKMQLISLTRDLESRIFKPFTELEGQSSSGHVILQDVPRVRIDHHDVVQGVSNHVSSQDHQRSLQETDQLSVRGRCRG